jgi:hypothetical protein
VEQPAARQIRDKLTNENRFIKMIINQESRQNQRNLKSGHYRTFRFCARFCARFIKKPRSFGTHGESSKTQWKPNKISGFVRIASDEA